MTLRDLVKHLRLYILDDSGGFGVDWENIAEDDAASQQLRWKNEELAAYINEAIRQVYRRTQPIEDASTFSITTEEGVASYSIDPRIIKILMIRSASTGKVLKVTDIHQYIEFKEFEVYESTPSGYMPDYQSGQIRFFPIPKAVDTYNLIVYRFPLKELTWDNPNQSPELRLEWQIPMLNYAAHLAYYKPDENTFSPDKANNFLQLFTAEFSDTSAYSETRKRRSTNRSVKYGGIPSTTFGRVGGY
jgi:hypothetical protein